MFTRMMPVYVTCYKATTSLIFIVLAVPGKRRHRSKCEPKSFFFLTNYFKRIVAIHKYHFSLFKCTTPRANVKQWPTRIIWLIAQTLNIRNKLTLFQLNLHRMIRTLRNILITILCTLPQFQVSIEVATFIEAITKQLKTILKVYAKFNYIMSHANEY